MSVNVWQGYLEYTASVCMYVGMLTVFIVQMCNTHHTMEHTSAHIFISMNE